MAASEGSTATAGTPSGFFLAHLEAIAQTQQLGPVLDLACGRGRHARVLAERGLRVVAVDRDRAALDALEQAVDGAPGRLQIVEADLEAGSPAALEPASFGAVLVFRFLDRSGVDWIGRLPAPGGLLVYETFLRAQRSLGWGPTRDEFMLEPGELRTLFPGLEELIYEEGPTADPRPARTARLLARRPVR